MTWSRACFDQLSELDQLNFPAQMTDTSDLPIKAMSKRLYRRTLATISHKGNLESLASQVRMAHQERQVAIPLPHFLVYNHWRRQWLEVNVDIIYSDV